MPRSKILKRSRQLMLLITAALAVIAIVTGGKLWRASQQATDAYLVLGGSIRREMHMAQLATDTAQSQPILISSGSMDPCIRLLFEQAGAPLDQVWLEDCAQSTLGNFVYTVPILERWNVHHVTLVTSGSHSRRAVTMARILLGVQGLWVSPLIVDETGIPGNQESLVKTSLDIGRSIGWAIVAQFHKPRCPGLTPLDSVDLEQWRQRGFKCEHQGGIEGS
ncbi:MAG: YdcF family protein [Cyanobacteria bacterium J06642_11]